MEIKSKEIITYPNRSSNNDRFFQNDSPKN
jgi:hypothetical protein